MKQEMFIDCRMSGSKQNAVRIIAVMDNQNDQVIISKILPYTPPKDPYIGKSPEVVAKMKEIERNTVVVVDNSSAFKKWDMHFVENDHLEEAIKAYYSLMRTHRLKLSDDVRQICDPENIIEIRKTDLRGNVYELNSDEVTNSHYAVLAICWSAIKVRNTAMINTIEEEPTQRDIDTFSVPFCI